jgi:hypothetical protein
LKEQVAAFLGLILSASLAACQSAPSRLRVWTTGDVGAPPEVADVYRAVLDEVFPRDSGPSLIVIDQLTEPTPLEMDFTAKYPKRPSEGVILPFRYRIPIYMVDSATRSRLYEEGRIADSAAYHAPMTSPLYYQRYSAPFITRFPGAWGRLSLGRVGFGPRLDYAVVYVRFAGVNPQSNSGQEVFRLAKIKGSWKVVERIPRPYESIEAIAPTYAMLHGWVDSSQIPPPRRKSLRVIVTDSTTGAPISAFGVTLQSSPLTKKGFPDDSKFPASWGNFFTNVRGEVVVRNPPPGTVLIEAQCPPERDVPGAKLAYAVLQPGAAIDTVITFRVQSGMCAELAPGMAAEARQHRIDVERAKLEAAARAVAGNRWGTLRDARTGRPIPRAWIRIDDRGGPFGTDSTGHFWLWGFPPGMHTLTIYCPVRRQFLPRVASTAKFYARPAMKDTADISASIEGCDDVPIDTVRVRTRGVWSIGFEDGFFTPCKPFTEIRLGGYRNYGEAFLVFAREGIVPPGGWPKVKSDNGTTRIFLDAEGDLIGPGSYGHLGVGTFLLRVTRVVSAKPASSTACPR